jgi:GTPase SAR1 family protein
VLCFEVGNEESIDWLHKQWYDQARPLGVKRCIVVGTKADTMSAAELEQYWSVASARLMLGEGMETFLTSSKTGDGVKAFVEGLYARLEERGNSQRDLVDLTAAVTKPGGGGSGGSNGCRC